MRAVSEPEAAAAVESGTGAKKSRLKRLVAPAIGILVVVATFVFILPQVASYADVWDVVKELSWVWIAALVGVTLLNLSTFAPPWMAALPGLGYRQGLAATQASTAVSIIFPGGAAVGMAGSYAMLRSWGFQSAAVARAVTVTGVWNQLATLSFPIIAAAALAFQGGRHALLNTAAFVGIGVLAVAITGLALVLVSSSLARDLGDVAARFVTWIKRKLRREPVAWNGVAFVHFRRGTIDLLRRRWHVLTVATIAGHLTVFVVLVVSLRALQVPSSEVSLAEAFAAWSLIRLLGGIPITPGGIGFVELGLTGLLVGFGGNNAGVVAAVLVYRFLTVVPTLVLGLLFGLTWRSHRPKEHALTNG